MARSARGHERAHVASLDEIASHYARVIRRAIAQLVDVDRAVRAMSALNTKSEKAPSIDAYQQALAAIRDAAHRPTPDFERIVRELYERAYVSGAYNAQETLDMLNFDMRDWRSVAELMGNDGGRGLRGMLDDSNVTIKSIEDSYLDRLAGVLADGIESGAGTSAIANDLRDLLDDPDRADMIARTETARAQTVGSLDEFREAGMGGKQVITSGDESVCPDCAENEDAGPVALDDDFPNGDPPVHPNCECAVMPVLESEMELMQKQADVARLVKNADAIAKRSIMIGWFLPAPIANMLALPTGESPSELHITLVFCGSADELPDDHAEKLCDMLAVFAADEPPVYGRVSGAGRFSSGDPKGEPIVALVDVCGLSSLRARLVDRLALERLAYRTEHDFTPHITVAYAMPHEDGPDDLPPPVPLMIDELTVTVGADRYTFALSKQEATG